MRARFLTLCLAFTLFALPGGPAAFADEGPTVSGGEGDSASPRDIPAEQCRALGLGVEARPEPVMGGGDERSPYDISGQFDTCPGALEL